MFAPQGGSFTIYRMHGPRAQSISQDEYMYTFTGRCEEHRWYFTKSIRNQYTLLFELSRSSISKRNTVLLIRIHLTFARTARIAASFGYRRRARRRAGTEVNERCPPPKIILAPDFRQVRYRGMQCISRSATLPASLLN